MTNIKIAEQITINHKDFKAEGFSEYMNGYYNGIIAGLEYAQSNVKTISYNIINDVAYPEWLTNEIRVLAKQTWDEHKDVNDHKRVEATKIIQQSAKSFGYNITIGKALELLQKHCLHNKVNP